MKGKFESSASAGRSEPGEKKRIILHLLNGTEIAGIFDYVTVFAKSMDDERDIEILLLFLRETGMVAEAIRRGLDAHVIARRHSYDIPAILRIRDFIRRKGVVAVHAHNVAACGVGMILKLICPKLKLIVSVRANVEKELASAIGRSRKKGLLLFSHRMALKRADHVMANSLAMRNWAVERGADESKTSVIYNGLDLVEIDSKLGKEGFTPVDDGSGHRRLVIGTVGRLTQIKNQEYLLQAARILKDAVPDIEVVIVGDGKRASYLKKLTAEMGLEKTVVFAGWQDDVYPFLAKMDVFVMPSLSESNPRALLQALACRKPVVATDVGGIPEIIEEGKNGILVPLNDPDWMAGAIGRLLTLPDLRERLGLEGRKTVEDRFTLEGMKAATEAVYSSVLDNQA